MSPEEVLTAFGARAFYLARAGRRFCNYAIPIDDLKQEALIGALHAAKTYAPGQGASFSTWVIGKMRYAVLDAIRTELHTRTYGRGVFIDPLQIEVPRGNAGQDMETLSYVPQVNPWEALERSIDAERLRRFARPVDLAVLMQRLAEVPQLVIAEQLGVSAGRVSQRELAAVAAMRDAAVVRPWKPGQRIRAKAKSAGAA